NYNIPKADAIRESESTKKFTNKHDDFYKNNETDGDCNEDESSSNPLSNSPRQDTYINYGKINNIKIIFKFDHVEDHNKKDEKLSYDQKDLSFCNNIIESVLKNNEHTINTYESDCKAQSSDDTKKEFPMHNKQYDRCEDQDQKTINEEIDADEDIKSTDNYCSTFEEEFDDYNEKNKHSKQKN
ncbi:hypothetical protein COBT_002790, partial [Conglomerata obtusa]